MAEVKWIQHNNRQILLVDFQGILLEHKMIELMHRVPPFLTGVGNDTLLVLTDITGCFLTPGFIEETKRMDKTVFDYYNRKEAIVGVKGPKVILLKAYNLFAKHQLVPFENRDLAFDYLTQE